MEKYIEEKIKELQYSIEVLEHWRKVDNFNFSNENLINLIKQQGQLELLKAMQKDKTLWRKTN